MNPPQVSLKVKAVHVSSVCSAVNLMQQEVLTSLILVMTGYIIVFSKYIILKSHSEV